MRGNPSKCIMSCVVGPRSIRRFGCHGESTMVAEVNINI